MQPIHREQYPLIDYLFKKAKLKFEISELQMEPMNDGGMGSHTFSTASKDSLFGGNKAEVSFMDIDGVEVTAALFIDQFGKPFELDVFKTDFSKLKKWPSEDELITQDRRNNI